jgi:uncharacterized protein (TIGR03435 family)
MKITTSALALFASLSCLAQSSAPGRPVFDAASIHPTDVTQKARSGVQTSPGALTMRGQTLRSCIQWAWGVQQFQVEGPDWLNDTRFDIVARASGDSDESQLRLMLRSTLAERFGLKVHMERKEMPVYALIVTKGGPKLQETTTEGPPVFGKDGNRPALTAQRASMKDLAEQISGPLNRPVIDATGLTGRYDIRIDVTPFMADPAGVKPESGGDTDVMSTILFVGMPAQLGLKLETRKDTVDILIVDHSERMPTAN